MTARERIADFLEQWRQLTQLEFQAIQRSDWTDLAKVQAGKTALREPLRLCLEDWTNTGRTAGQPERGAPFYCATVDHLLALETRNLDLLNARKETLSERKRAVEQAARNLRMVRDSYAPNPAMKFQVYS